METNALISFPRLAAVLEQYGQSVCDAYRQQLAEKGKNASGILSSSVRYVVAAESATYAVDLSLAEYWKYVEYGRSPGRFPPPDKILEWIRIKPVLPRPLSDGRIPTEKQLAYLIGRKIAREGIAPTPALEAANASVYNLFLDRIGEAIAGDLAEAVDGALAGLSNR